MGTAREGTARDRADRDGAAQPPTVQEDVCRTREVLDLVAKELDIKMN